MKATELRKMSQEDLKGTQQKLWREQIKWRVAKSMGELVQTHKFKEIRRDLARIETILNEKTG